MRLLEHMDRTEKGLTDKLRQAEFSPEAVERFKKSGKTCHLAFVFAGFI